MQALPSYDRVCRSIIEDVSWFIEMKFLPEKSSRVGGCVRVRECSVHENALFHGWCYS